MNARTRIVRIGNSRGVRIPKRMLEEGGIEGEVTISLEEGTIVIRSASRPREGWEEQLNLMVAEEGIGEFPTETTRFDREEWEWE